MSFEEIKNILYEVLTAGDNEGQTNLEPMIKATQNMGVSVSSAVAKNGGVNIFQLQNIVHQKVIKNVVEALKIIDKMPLLLVPVEPLLIEEPKEQIKTLEEVIEDALDNDLTYSDFLNGIGKQFIFAAIARHNTHKETAAAIKVSYSKLMQVKKTVS